MRQVCNRRGTITATHPANGLAHAVVERNDPASEARQERVGAQWRGEPREAWRGQSAHAGADLGRFFGVVRVAHEVWTPAKAVQ
jgi:hypothetical protein